MDWYPEPLVVPTELRTAELVLEVLRPAHTERDYAALMEEPDYLRRWSASSWPRDDFTLAENRADLVEHEQEWAAREAFAYTVLDAQRARCEGCVYIEPAAQQFRRLRFAPDYAPVSADPRAALFSFWVRPSGVARDLDRQLLAGLHDWFLSDWQFQDVFCMTPALLPREGQLCRDLGLTEAALVTAQERGAVWSLFRLLPAPAARST